jgi:putative DNA primase/helicase
VPFEVTIPLEQRDPRLPLKLRAELPGILNWALEGCRQWQVGGLQAPSRVIAATSRYQEESDVLGAFLTEKCVVSRSASVSSSSLYSAYKLWCENGGEYVLAQRVFAGEMQHRGMRLVHERKGNEFRGVRLRTQQDSHLAVVDGEVVEGETK